MTQPTVDDYYQLINKADENWQSMESLLSLEAAVLESGKVDQSMMASYSRWLDGTSNAQYPLSSYTKVPSEQNLEIALESFEVGKVLLAVGAGALLASILAYLVKRMRRNSNLADELSAMADLHKKTEAHYKAATSMVDKKSIPDMKANDAEIYTAIVNNDWATMMSLDKDAFPYKTVVKSTQNGKAIIDAISTDGTISKEIRQVARGFNQQFSIFTGRVHKIADIIDSMYTVRGDAINKSIEELKSLTAKENKGFADQMRRMKATLESLGLTESIGETLQTEVFYTKEYFDDVFKVKIEDLSNLMPANLKQMDKNLKELERYSAKLQGHRDAARTAKEMRRAPQITNTDAGVEMVIDGSNTTAINPMLLKAIQDAELSVRAEVESYRIYQNALDLVFKYTGVMINTRSKIVQYQHKTVREIENRLPAK